jgi:hypothetical protein
MMSQLARFSGEIPDNLIRIKSWWVNYFGSDLPAVNGPEGASLLSSVDC